MVCSKLNLLFFSKFLFPLPGSEDFLLDISKFLKRFILIKNNVDIVEDWVRYGRILSYPHLRDHRFHRSHIIADFGLKPAEDWCSFAAYLERAIYVQRHFVLNSFHFLGLLKKLCALLLPLPVSMLRFVLLFHQSFYLRFNRFKVFLQIFVGLFLSQLYIFIDLHEPFLNLRNQPIFDVSNLWLNVFLKFFTVAFAVNRYLLCFETLKLFVPGLHHLINLADSFKLVVFMASEKSAMRTQFDSIIDANDLCPLLVLFAKISLWMIDAGTGNCITRRLLVSATVVKGVRFLLQHFHKCDIFRKVFDVHIVNAFLMTTKLALNDCYFIIDEKLFEAIGTGTMFAIRHHPRLTVLRKKVFANTANLFLLIHFISVLIFSL